MKKQIGMVAGAMALAAGLVLGTGVAANATDDWSGSIACGTRTFGTNLTASGYHEIKHTSGANVYRWYNDSGWLGESAYRNWGVHSGTWRVIGNPISSHSYTCYN